MRKLKLFLSLLMLFTFSVGNVWATDYQLVTSTDDLEAGAHYVMGATYNNKTYFASTVSNNNNRKLVEATVTDGVVTASETMMSFTLGGSSTGWTFATDNYGGTAGYLNATNTTGSNNLKVVAALDNYAYFTIEIASSGDASITCTGKSSKNIMYLNGSTCISCYNTQTTAQYKKLRLYKEVSAEPTLSAVTVSGTPTKTTYEEGDAFDVTGLTVTGTYTVGDPATITEGITWEVRTNSTSDAVALASYTLTKDQTALQVRATVEEIASDWFDVTGLTVNALSCSNVITITKGTPEHGSFDLTGAGVVCIDEGNASATVSNIVPAEGYRFKEITTTAGTVDGMNITGIDGDATINVVFEEIPSHKVYFYNGSTLLNAGGTDVKEGAAVAYSGTAPTSCDDESTNFAGWTTATWSGKVAKADIESAFYESTLPVMGESDVTYYAVFCKGGNGVGGITNDEIATNASADTGTSGQYAERSYSSASGNWEGIFAYNTQQNESVIQITNSSNRHINSPTFDGNITRIEITYTNGSSSARSFSFANGDNTLGSISATGSAKKATGSLDVTGSYSSFVLTAPNGALYIHSIRVTYGSETSNYMTTCCEKHSITIADNIQHGEVTADLTQACEGTEVTLSATPDDHCRFVEWNVTAGGNAVEVNNQNKFSMPDADVTVSATFEEIKNAVTVADNIVGGSVEVTGTDNLASVLEGTALTVTATPDAENHYIGGVIIVKDGENNDVTASVLEGSTLTMPDYAITISATFTPTYAINIVADGGSVALTYDKNGAADGYALAGTEISAEATADDAHEFTSLAISENVTEPTIVDNLAEFTMPASAVTITATFAAKTTPTINVDAEVLEFDAVDYKGELATKTFTVSGVALAAGKLSITCDNAAFAVSPAEIDVVGTLAETEISVTPVTTTCGKFDGTITVSGGNATAKEILVSLTVNKLAANLSWSASEATVTIDANDNVFPTLVNPRGLENIVYSSLDETVATINASTGAIELVGPGETYIIANFAGNDTVAALAEDALYYTLTVQKKYTAKYFINGQEQKAAEQTALAGTELVFPTDFSSFTDCSDLTFVGWAEAAIEGKQDEAPTYTTKTVMPEADVNFYAVFATAELGEGSSTEIKYSGTETINMTGGNDAATFGLDADEWSIVGDKGGNSNYPGLNKVGDIRLYYHSEGGNTLTITAPKTIDSVKISFQSSYANGWVKVNNEAVTPENGAYPIKATSFVIGNANTSNVQVRFDDVTAIFNGSTTYSDFRTICPSCATVTLAKAATTNGSFTLTVGGVEVESVKTCEAATVDVAFDPAPGYKLDEFTISGVEGATYADGKISIPSEATGTLTATATFVETNYTVTLEQTGDASATLSGATDAATYGATINISAPEVEGFVFTKWTTSDAELVNAYASATSFTMPAKNVKVSANYARLYTVAALMESEEDISNVAVRGYVTSIKEAYSTTHHNISYYISDNGKEDVRLQSYRGVGEDAENITVGDKVLVTGNFTTSYSGELTAGNTLLSRVALASIAIDASEAATAYEAGDAFELNKVKAIATYGEATVDVTAWATWTPTDAPIITEAGNVEISATWCGQSDNETVAVTLKPEAPISWGATEAAVTYGDTYVLPTLTNEHTLAVTYSSDNTDVATISNEEGHEGEITIKAVGTTTISAEFAGNDTYKATTVSYVLTVTCATLPAPTNLTVSNIYLYGADFSWDAVANADGYYLEVALYDDPTDQKAMIGGLKASDLSYSVNNLEAGTHYTYFVKAFNKDEVNYCNGGWSVATTGDFWTDPYYITGSFNGWAMTPMTADSFVFENLEVGTPYEIKVSIDGTFDNGQVKGFADLTPDEMVAGLYSGTNDNIVFTLAKAGKVVVTYNQREFKVVGEFEAQSVELAGYCEGNWDWDSHVQAELSDDRKSATAKKTFNKDEWVTFKMVVDSKWMGTSGDEDYKLTRDNNSVSGLFADGKNQYFQADKTGEYEFTWTFGTNAVTVKFPDHSYTVAWSLAAGPDETLGELERQLDFEGDPTDSYTLTMLKDVLQTGTFNVKVFEDDATTPIATTTLNIDEVAKYELSFLFYYDGAESTVTASATDKGDPTGVDETGDGQKAVKVMKDNTIYIIRGDKTYTITGQVVK